MRIAAPKAKALAAVIAKAPTLSKKNWCGQEDSNLHKFPRHHLKVVRLPIPPWPQTAQRNAHRDWGEAEIHDGAGERKWEGGENELDCD